jgi:hypothetical protein
MFNRQYFIAGEIQSENAPKIQFFRHFGMRSFFPNSILALKFIEKSITVETKCMVTDIHIAAFNRC